MISLVMTTFNRPYQLLNTLKSIDVQCYPSCEIIVVDDGDDDRTKGICSVFDVNYLKLDRPKSDSYRNQARPLNVGIRCAAGSIILLGNAECRHVDPNTIQRLTERVTSSSAVFAHVTQMNEDGTRGICYCGPENPRPYFFCGAIRRERLMRIRGFDEDYQGYGYEDNDMADRLHRSGVTFEFTDIKVEHQWHPQAGIVDDSASKEMFRIKQQMGIERNLGRGWGVL